MRCFLSRYSLWSVYGITADLRLALFSEIFEPLSEFLDMENRIDLIKSSPILERKEKCPACGCEYKVTKTGKLFFYDKLMSVILTFGLDIFVDDDVTEIVKRTVNTRNKMLHVDAEKKNTFSGGQCGFYARKYVELYRVIVLQQINMWTIDMNNELKKLMRVYNKQFSKLRIRK